MKITTAVRVTVAVKTIVPGVPCPATDFYSFKMRVDVISPDVKEITLNATKALKEKGINPIEVIILGIGALLGNELQPS